jgi:type VI secretion system protein ImpA
MAFEEQIIPIESLLVPIGGDNPSGSNLYYTDVFDQIREARRSEYNVHRGEWIRPMKVPDWAQVVCLASDALQNRAKDLVIVCWLTEALAKTKGFAGIRPGLKLLRLTIQGFWDTLYPEIDEGDLEARANALILLDRELDSVIGELPLTNSPSGARYGYNQWQESTRYRIPQDPEQARCMREVAAAENKVTSEQWNAAFHATSDEFYKQMNVAAHECWDELRLLQCTVDERFGFQAPDFTKTRRALKNAGRILNDAVDNRRNV